MRISLVHEWVTEPIVYSAGMTNRRRWYRYMPVLSLPTHLGVLAADGPPTLMSRLKHELETYIRKGETGGPMDIVPRQPYAYPICGVGWYSRDFADSCTSDGFLTAFIIELRKSKGFLLDQIRVFDEAAIRLMAISRHVLERGNLMSDNYIKRAWFEPLVGALLSELPKPVDLKGPEVNAVYQHLMNHGGLVLETSCRCGKQYIRTPHLEMHGVLEFERLQEVLQGKQGSYLSVAGCYQCKGPRTFSGITSVGYPWFIHVSCTRFGSQLLSRFEKSVEFMNATFDVAYLSLVQEFPATNTTHQTTFHFLNGTWYYFDSLSGHVLKESITPLASDYRKNRFLTGVTYFRRTYRGPGFQPLP